MRVANEETDGRGAAVYRLWDAEGALLYVGSAYDPEARCKGHRGKPWWSLVARRTDEWKADRISAYCEELEEIRRHQPPYNVMGTSRYVCPDTPGTRRRAELSRLRHRAKVDARQARSAMWEEALAVGETREEAARLADLAYITVLDTSGVWVNAVAQRREWYLRLYGAV